METIIAFILEYKYLLICFLSLILLILVIILLKPKKVKPIEITKDDVIEEKSEIEKVIEALEENPNSRPMTTFEEEQEANAIISYQELLKAVEEKKAHMEVTPVNNDTILNEVDLSNVEETPVLEKEEKIDDLKPNNDLEKPKFKNSEFISPVFGKDNANDDFLKELKDFRNNL